jgi:hypothetical protein
MDGRIARYTRTLWVRLCHGASIAQRRGHDVIERDPDYPATATISNVMLRYLRGVHELVPVRTELPV